MKHISSEIQINATPQRVWEVLTDFAELPQWNPFIRSAEGVVKEGERLKVYIRPPNGMGMTFTPTVLKAHEGSELRWIGRLLMPGIFDGEHYFIIEPLGEGHVRFTQGEKFTGVLVPLFGIMGIFRKTQAGFEEMNQALKQRAERSSES